MNAERLPWIAEDPASLRLFELAQKVAPSAATLLITGESGSGKDYFARVIHELSPRRDAPFLKFRQEPADILVNIGHHPKVCREAVGNLAGVGLLADRRGIGVVVTSRLSARRFQMGCLRHDIRKTHTFATGKAAACESKPIA